MSIADGHALVQGVIANQEDNARWLILADWLAEDPDVEPMLEDAIRHFVAGRVFKSCDQFMYSCGENLTNGQCRQHDLEVLAKDGCDDCRHWASSQIVQSNLILLLKRTFPLPAKEGISAN